ncbi:MAG: NHLP bacteriocin export ABC transporter permease/ATPase subunit [Gemmatimonadaceae bacterium]|nr:NHLP bacteriocin export ABC transporter permease/ATPase subunit [Gemmatimonadaceae bacterium]
MRHTGSYAAPDQRDELLRVATRDGRLVVSGSDRPFTLESDRVWLVAQGEVHVFSALRDANGEAGSRSHVLTVPTGGAVLGFGTATDVVPGRLMLAVGSTDTQLIEVSREWLGQYHAMPQGRPAVHTLVDAWVEALSAGISRDVAPKRCAELELGREIKVSQAVAARPRAAVGWVRHLEGHSLFLGRESLTVNGSGYTPIARRAWLHMQDQSRVHMLPTDGLPDEAALWQGLDTLHAIVLRYADLVAARGRAADRDRLQRRGRAAAARLADACRALAATLQGPDRRAAATEDVTGNAGAKDMHAALYEASRLVGSAMGVTIRPYATSETGQAPRDPLEAIARSSRIRVRRVALRDAWWRQENGPLLGYTEGDMRPVALLPERGGYRLQDPLAATVAPVTAENAAGIHAFAYTFYRPFPDTELTVRDVLSAGLFGCRRDLLVVLAMGAAGALLGLVPAMATGRMFNTIIPGAERSQLVQMTLVLVVCAMTTAMFNVTRGLALLRIEARMAGSVQSAVWDRLLSLPMPFFRSYTAGDLAVRAMNIDAIRQVVSGTTVTAIIGGVFSLVNFALMFHYSSTLAWRATILIGVAVAVTSLGSILQLRHQRAALAVQARTSGLVLELLSSIAKLRVAGAERHAFAVWAARFSDQRRIQYRVRQLANGVQAFNGAFPVLAMTVLFWAAMPMLSAGTMIRTGDFLAFLSAYGACQGALLGTCAALLSTLNVIPLYEQAKPILRTRPEVDDDKSDPGTLTGDIAIQRATFRYATDGPQVLRDLSLQVAPGEFVAFVGPSGSGKSTILRLLLGFEKLESGGIYYDGQELGRLDVQAVRRQIGVVLQNGRLMSGDIFTNIVGSAPLTMDDAWEAARMAGFDDDVKAMPMGMHTVISEGGGTLSGGQRQRLMIARAIVQRPRILFFDEATSALDNRTQRIVSESLERLNATRVVVAHRLSTIVNADRIIVIDRGQVVESGRYEELMLNGGPFAELARRQLA